MGTESAPKRGMRSAAAMFLLLCATAAHADKESLERYFQALDLNGDGYVSLAEAAGDPVIVNRFDRADRNRDGKLSEKEFARLSKVKVRVAKAHKDKQDVSAATGGTKARPEGVKKASAAAAGD
jgi:Ca2+-binding EF-hand superfamily protein